MNTTTVSLPSDMGSAAAEGIRDILERSVGSANIATFAEAESPMSWKALVDSGWTQIADGDDDDALTLRDLVDVVSVWGEYCVPLPLVITLLTRRHSAAARSHDGPVSVAVPTPQTMQGWAVVPFGQFPSVVLLDAVDAPSVIDMPESSRLEFAPTLQLTEIPVATTLSDAAAREFAVLWAAEAAGIARRLVSVGVDYVSGRDQFGKPIGSFQAVKHILADAHIDAEQAETSVLWAAADSARSFDLSTHGIDLAIVVAERVVQVHGGMGFTWEMGLHYYLRHLVTLRDLVAGLARSGR
ncbi:acyl-CoA dehydrogenase [Rhodococcus sp. Eu-32]|uniref:acyl-CoA dehydrogenase family protein n=1 Tax=Rhodococcus sp. Eu-32 TaxID=1017319 RepID=UPI000DF357B8|nr:acyl-CoA dehydrogenase family protein [Rhodococcus sp. Eu-32]RRQ25624.1 acyl-CoA dehydrogenase [Rhodococcus sp. Eu-32]